MLNESSIKEALKKIKYLDWEFRLHRKDLPSERWKDKVMEHHAMFFIQVIFMGPDANTGKIEEQRCRWFLLDTDKDENEIYRTVDKAIQDAVLHEMYENFYVDGKRVRDPHTPYV